jgi:hypothetical protein
MRKAPELDGSGTHEIWGVTKTLRGPGVVVKPKPAIARRRRARTRVIVITEQVA